MENESGLILLGEADLKEAKRLKAALEERKVKVELAGDLENCSTGGCSPKVKVLAKPEDLAAVQEFLREERAKIAARSDLDDSLLGEVFDSEKETARCPACGETFSTKLTECPSCGLGFGVPE